MVYECDSVLFSSYELAVSYANDYFKRFGIVLGIEKREVL